MKQLCVGVGCAVVIAMMIMGMVGCTSGKTEKREVTVTKDSVPVNVENNSVADVDEMNVEGETFRITDKIFLNRDTMYYVHCYVNGKRVFFHDEILDSQEGGILAMKARLIDRYAYVVGEVNANQLSFVDNFHVYRIDTLDYSVLHIGDFAAVHFKKDGFMVAEARVLNPDTIPTAAWIFEIHNCYYDKAGTLIRKDKRDIDYKELERKYGVELINADGIHYN